MTPIDLGSTSNRSFFSVVICKLPGLRTQNTTTDAERITIAVIGGRELDLQEIYVHIGHFTRSLLLSVRTHVGLQLGSKSAILSTCFTSGMNFLVLLQLCTSIEHQLAALAGAMNRYGVPGEGPGTSQYLATVYALPCIGVMSFWMDGVQMSF